MCKKKQPSISEDITKGNAPPPCPIFGKQEGGGYF